MEKNEFEKKIIARLASINLYKFFLPIVSTCYNIVSSNCRENNKPFNITLHPRNFYITVITGFYEALQDLIHQYAKLTEVELQKLENDRELADRRVEEMIENEYDEK